MDKNNTEEDRLGRVKQHYGTKGKPPVIQPKPTRKLKIKPTTSPVVDQPPPSLGTTTTYNGKKDSNSDEEVWSISEYLFLLLYLHIHKLHVHICTCTCYMYMYIYVHIFSLVMLDINVYVHVYIIHGVIDNSSSDSKDYMFPGTWTCNNNSNSNS